MPEFTAEDLQGPFDAFNHHDIDAVMSYFADDIVLDTVAAPEATAGLCASRHFARTVSCWIPHRERQRLHYRHPRGDKNMSTAENSSASAGSATAAKAPYDPTYDPLVAPIPGTAMDE